MAEIKTQHIDNIFFDVNDSKEFDTEFKGWDCKPFRLQNLPFEINITTLGFTLSRGNMQFPLTKLNYDDNRQIFAAITSELLAKSEARLRNLIRADTRLDGEIINGKTPDLVFYGSNSKFKSDEILSIEFKSSIMSYTTEMFEDLISSIRTKYGEGFGRVRVFFTKLDVDFPSKFKAGPNFELLYTFVLTQFLNFGSKFAGRKVMMSDWARPFDHLFKYTEDKLNIDFGDSIVKEVANYTDEEFVKDNIDLLIAGEKFFDENYLVQSDAASIMFQPVLSREPNIWSDHPWDRDKNRLATNRTDYGHRSLFLTDFPIHKNLKGGDSALKEHFGSLMLALKGLKEQFKFGKEDEEFGPFQTAVKIADQVIRAYIPNEGEILQIKQLQREIAWTMTEQTKQALVKKNIPNFKAQIDSLRAKIEGFKIAIKSKTDSSDINVTKSGYVRFPLKKPDRHFTGIKRTLEKHTKPEKDHLDLDTLEFDFDNFILNFPKGPGFNVDLDDFYPSNTDVNKKCNELNTVTKGRMDQIMSDRMFGYMYWTQKLYRGYLTQFPKLASKRVQNGDFGMFAVPGLPIYCIASAPPNDITTGGIVTFSFVSAGTKVPEGFQEQMVVNIDVDTDLWISKPFRINLRYMGRYEEILAAWVGLQSMSIEYGSPMLSNGLFNSLFLRYTRQLNQVSDALYLLMKNALNYGTIGRKEYPKKFDQLETRDIRVGLIVKNLVANYKKFAEDMRKFNEDALGKKFNIKDPIFGNQHKNIQTYLLVTYIKQIYIKNDGFDENWIAYDFFVKEDEHQKEFEKSRFNPNSLDPRVNMPMSKFIKMLFRDDGDMEKVSYHNRSCKFLISKLFDEAVEKKPTIKSADNFIDILADESVVNSRVNVFDKLLPDNLNKKSKESKFGKGSAGKYVGIQSMPQSEAIQVEILNFKDFVEKHLKVERERLNNYTPTLSDLLIYELSTYPNHAVLTVKVKEQKGYAKRIFFIQTVDNRNLNKLLDESLNGLLKNVSEDMIVIPGDFKLEDLEKKMSSLGFEVTKGLMLTGDQTKFGDKYPLETFDILIDTLWEKGYYNKPQRNLFRLAIERLKGRVTLAPPNSDKLLSELKDDKDPNKTSSVIGNRQEKRLQKARLLREITSNPNTWAKFVVDKNIQDKVGLNVTNNLAISKFLGFVLGVFNKLGSTYSSAHFKAMDIFLSHIGLRGIIKGATHSDDSIKFVAVPSITQLDLSMVSVKELLLKLKSGVKLASNPNQRHVVMLDPNNKGPAQAVAGDLIVKLVALLDLYMPRLVGQNPSLTKTGYGPAGEVLQVFALFGAMIPPIMRYLAAIGADLPGKSPSIDLASAVGRVYKIMVDGGSIQLINDSLIIANWFVWQRYGLEPHKFKKINRKVPEIGGFNYFYPPLLLEQGFAANEIRLLALANSGETVVKNQMLLLMDTDAYFSQKDTFELESQKVDDNTETDVSLSSENIKGVVSTRKTFDINYVRNMKTMGIFFSLYENMEREIEIDAKTYLDKKIIQQDDYDSFVNEKRVARKVQILKSALTTRILTRTNGTLEKSVNFLSKYLTKPFQESYLRIPEGVMLVNRLGYLKRYLSNPFSKSIRNLGPKFDKERFKIKSIWKRILKLSVSGDFPASVDNNRFFTHISSLWSELTAQVYGIKTDFESTRKAIKNDKELNLRWTRIQPKFSAPLINISPSLIIAIAIEQRKFKLPFDKLPTVMAEPWLVNNSHVKQALDNFLSFIDRLQFNVSKIQRNVNMLGKIFQSHGVVGLARIPMNEGQPLRAVVMGNWEANEWRKGTFDGTTSRTEVPIEQEIFTSSQKAKILSTVTTLATLTKLHVDNFVVSRFQKEINLRDMSQQLKDKVKSEFEFTSDAFNNWMAAVIYEQTVIGKSEILFWRSNKNTDSNKRFYGIFVDGHYYYLRILYVKQADGKIVVQRNDTGEVMYHGFTTNSRARETTFYFYLISFFLIRKALRLKSLFQFEVSKDRKGSFWVIRENEMTPSDPTGNRKIFLVSSNKAHSDLSNNVDQSIFREMSFHIKPKGTDINDIKKTYVISTWKVTKFPTEVTYTIKEFGETVGEFKDNAISQSTADIAKFKSVGFFHPTGDEWFPISSAGSQSKFMRQLFIVYYTYRKHLGLDLKFISVDSTELDVIQYTDFHKFFFYAGITSKNIHSVRTSFELEEEIPDRAEAEANLTINEINKLFDRDEFDVPLTALTENEENLIRIIIDRLNIDKVLYPNSKEALVLISAQKILFALKSRMPISRIKEILSTWFLETLPNSTLDLLGPDSSTQFLQKFKGFKWGTPGAISTSYFVNLITLLDPTYIEIARSLTKTTFSAFWHGNAAIFVKTILATSTSDIVSNLLPKALTFHHFDNLVVSKKN